MTGHALGDLEQLLAPLGVERRKLALEPGHRGHRIEHGAAKHAARSENRRWRRCTYGRTGSSSIFSRRA